jgi:hypothetical protein
MGPQAGCGRKNLLLLLLLISLATITTQAKADFMPPSLKAWLGTEDTSGIFASGKVIFNITSGLQYRPTMPQIKFRSNAEAIDLGLCVADFRLLRVDVNNTLTETDYVRYSINSVDSKSGHFWASMIREYPSTYRVGVVIWNSSDGSVVGRLIRTIEASGEPVVALKSDNVEFGPSDSISLTLVNHGPALRMGGEVRVYREFNGTWVLLGPYLSNDGVHYQVEWIHLSLEHNETRKVEVGRFSQSGVYLITIGDEFMRASTEFLVVYPDMVSPSGAVDRVGWMLLGASIGAVTGLGVYY